MFATSIFLPFQYKLIYLQIQNKQSLTFSDILFDTNLIQIETLHRVDRLLTFSF